MIRELRSTTINGYIYLFPVPVYKERKYLILCQSLAEAQKIIELVAHSKLTHPDLKSEDFVFITYHTDKQTRILSLNPKINILST